MKKKRRFILKFRPVLMGIPFRKQQQKKKPRILRGILSAVYRITGSFFSKLAVTDRGSKGLNEGTCNLD